MDRIDRRRAVAYVVGVSIRKDEITPSDPLWSTETEEPHAIPIPDLIKTPDQSAD
jgi:hypothetical protein